MTKLTNVLSATALSFVLATGLGGAAQAAGGGPQPPMHEWSFNGLFGTFDRAALQRGYRVYKDVCAACHGLKYIAFRNLVDIGFTEAEAKALAEEFEVAGEPDEFGDPTTRTARLSDTFPDPFPNPQAARAANGGALPPDLTLTSRWLPGCLTTSISPVTRSRWHRRSATSWSNWAMGPRRPSSK